MKRSKAKKWTHPVNAACSYDNRSITSASDPRSPPLVEAGTIYSIKSARGRTSGSNTPAILSDQFGISGDTRSNSQPVMAIIPASENIFSKNIFDPKFCVGKVK
jgi:hypothetical protein